MNYKKAYLNLFNEVSDIIDKLKAAQRRSEDACTTGGDVFITLNKNLGAAEGEQTVGSKDAYCNGK